MKVRFSLLFSAALVGSLFVGIPKTWAASDEVNAIEAVRQAPDPSSVVAAFASGSALTPDDPKLLDAYVRRMDELGMPEIAFHQAQALATMDPRNGLGWATVAYVEARRNDMPDALSAIDKAVRYAPDDVFVQRTAGGVVAWYDSNSATSQATGSEAAMLSNVRNLMGSKSAYATAYADAKQAYSNPGSVPGQAPSGPPAQVGPTGPLSGYSPAYPPDYGYAPDYYAGLGPDEYVYSSPYYYPPYATWDPWPWWEPAGYFYGSVFVPFGGFVFGDHDHYGHHGGYLGHGFDHNRFIAHGGAFNHRGFAAGSRAGAVHQHGFTAGGHRPYVFVQPGLRSSASTFSRGLNRPSSGFASSRLNGPAWGSFQGHSMSRGFSGTGGFRGLNQGHVMGGGGVHSFGGMARGGGFGGGHGERR